MAYNRGRFLWSLGGPRSALQHHEVRRVNMEWTTVLAILVTIGLVGYLTLALLLPERFS